MNPGLTRRLLPGPALLVAVLLPIVSPALAASERLRALADEVVEREYDLAPIRETYARGPGPRAGRELVDLSPGAEDRARSLYGDVLRRLESIPVTDLGESDRITHEMLALHAGRELARREFPLADLQILTPMRSFASSMFVLANVVQPLRTEADFEAWLSRVDATSRSYDHAAARLRSAARKGWTTPRVLVERTLPQLEALAAGPAERNPLWAVVARYPKEADDAKRTSFEERYRHVLESRHIPAIRRFIAFVREEYLPAARPTAGLGALPGGDRAYRALVRHHTTLDLAPDEVHALGLSEVARIRARLLEVARGLGFKGDMKDFHGWVQSNPANFPFHAAEEVLEYMRNVNRRVEPALPKLFHKLPRSGLDIRLVEPALAASASVTYMRPPEDGSRPGSVSVPVTDPRKSAAYGLTALQLHEGLPGHHLDLGRRVEMKLPRFRKQASATAYSEGWGLYAESLGHELGLYDDPWALLGRYAAELHRAARLVVDTGLHAKAWTREQAIRYLVEERGASEESATRAVERYMGDPGQALAYKVGELEILRLREAARRALGARFDIRDFHEVVLEEGPLPLPLLRKRVESWMQGESRRLR